MWKHVVSIERSAVLVLISDEGIELLLHASSATLEHFNHCKNIHC